MTETFEYCKRFILRWEGGFVNHPKDPGGATNKGITISTYRHYFGNGKSVEDLKHISDDEWNYIFSRGYYSPLKADLIKNKSIALLCVDMCWGSGAKTAIKKIQRCLGCDADGIVGPKTLAALNGENSKIIFQRLWTMRKNWFYSIVKNRPSSAVFLKGWLNRLNSIKYIEDGKII